MSEIESIFRTAAREGLDPMDIGALVLDELDRSYVELPVDSDGEPIHIGDELVFQPSGMRDKVRFLTHNGGEWMVNDRGWNPAFTHHYRPRTIEDVLLSAGVSLASVGDVADEIRELAKETYAKLCKEDVMTFAEAAKAAAECTWQGTWEE